MQTIKKSDHNQIEIVLQSAYTKGYGAGHRDGWEKRQEYAAQEAGKKAEQERSRWQQAVEKSLDMLKGIGEKRKGLFLDYLKENLKDDVSD